MVFQFTGQPCRWQRWTGRLVESEWLREGDIPERRVVGKAFDSVSLIREEALVVAPLTAPLFQGELTEGLRGSSSRFIRAQPRSDCLSSPLFAAGEPVVAVVKNLVLFLVQIHVWGSTAAKEESRQE